MIEIDSVLSTVKNNLAQTHSRKRELLSVEILTIKRHREYLTACCTAVFSFGTAECCIFDEMRLKYSCHHSDMAGSKWFHLITATKQFHIKKNSNLHGKKVFENSSATELKFIKGDR